MMSAIGSLLVVLNERPGFPHVDVRNGLQELRDQGEIDNFEIFSWSNACSSGNSSGDIVDNIIRTARRSKAEVILWTHTPGLKTRSELTSSRLGSRLLPVIGYWEGDLYESPFKKMPSEVIHVAVSADVVFCQGFGPMTGLLKKHGVRRFEYVPAPTDKWRFIKSRSNSTNLSYDVVMVGNNISSKLPWRTMPGARWRTEVVSFFQKKLGPRFIVFGDGWSGPCAGGPIPFDQQVPIYHTGRVALGVNNLHAKYYFSNRLPIAMSSGVPVVHNYESGFGEIFDAGSGISFFRNTAEAWDVVKGLLEKTQEELDEIGSLAQAFSSSRFSVTTILHFMLRTLAVCKDQGGRDRASGYPEIINPWIGRLR